MLHKTQKYYDLLDLFEQENCPLCVLKEKWVSDFIETFLYEGVNDRKMRKKIQANGGFCYDHAHAMMSHGDPLAHGILYSVLIDEYISSPSFAEPAKQSFLKKVKQEETECLICELERNADISTVRMFLDFFENSPEFVDKFSETKTCLCKPHTDILKTVTKNKELIQKVTEIQKENLLYLKGCLDEIVRKHDYRYKGEELTPEERLAWQRAVRLMVGL